MDIARIIANRAGHGIISCDVSASVGEAVALLANKRIGALPVIQNGAVVGIFSERDVIYRLAEEGALCLSRRVGDVMTAPPITVDAGTRRSEERRLGKEWVSTCRSRWRALQKK